MRAEFILPDWPAPARVQALQTTRHGGISSAPYHSLNLGDHVGDDAASVISNRQSIAAHLPASPFWLQQVHGNTALQLPASGKRVADACWTRSPAQVCVVMTADCLPLLLCDQAGSVVAAIHAGWRGLCQGVIESTVTAMGQAPGSLMAWLGPAIGPQSFEVGPEVRAAFLAHDPDAGLAFQSGQGDRWLADIYCLAKQRLQALGVEEIYGGNRCTFAEEESFFSFRRDGQTGRMGTFIWIAAESV